MSIMAGQQGVQQTKLNPYITAGLTSSQKIASVMKKFSTWLLLSKKKLYFIVIYL